MRASVSVEKLRFGAEADQSCSCSRSVASLVSTFVNSLRSQRGKVASIPIWHVRNLDLFGGTSLVSCRRSRLAGGKTWTTLEEASGDG
jgi:hypothetical protein